MFARSVCNVFLRAVVKCAHARVDNNQLPRWDGSSVALTSGTPLVVNIACRLIREKSFITARSAASVHSKDRKQIAS